MIDKCDSESERGETDTRLVPFVMGDERGLAAERLIASGVIAINRRHKLRVLVPGVHLGDVKKAASSKPKKVNSEKLLKFSNYHMIGMYFMIKHCIRVLEHVFSTMIAGLLLDECG